MIGRWQHLPRRGRQHLQPPRWSTPRTRPRVLVEHADPAVRDHLVRGLAEHGYDALGCGGPTADRPCPLLEGRPCPASAQADAIVTGLAHRPTGREIAAAVDALSPGRPMIAEGSPLMLAGAEGSLPVTPAFPLDLDALAAALDEHLTRS